jgi:hypothetical protein
MTKLMTPSHQGWFDSSKNTFYLEASDVRTTLQEEVRTGHSYIFLEEEGSSCPDPLEENTKDETQKMHCYDR